MKTISLLIGSLAGGGAERVCVNIANQMAENGWHVELLVLNRDNERYYSELSNKVNYVSLDTSNARYALFGLFKYIKSNKPAKLLVFNYELTVLLIVLRMFGLFQYKIISRNINNFSKKKAQAKGLWRRVIVMGLVSKLYSKSDFIINQSKLMEQDLIEHFPRLQSKSAVIYNPVSTTFFDYKKQDNLDDSPYILCVGRLESQKSFYHALKAFSNVSSLYPELRIKFIGTGTLYEALRRSAVELQISDKVDFEGYQDDVLPYYTHAKLTLLTSLYEGFPNVLVESISLGIPVVSYDCPTGPSEIIVNGENGFLAENQNLEHLTKCIHKTLNHDWNIDVIRSTSQRYHIDRIVDEYTTCINNI